MVSLEYVFDDTGHVNVREVVLPIDVFGVEVEDIRFCAALSCRYSQLLCVHVVEAVHDRRSHRIIMFLFLWVSCFQCIEFRILTPP